MKEEERLTRSYLDYKINYLHKLWEYENTGHQPNEIVPKEGSPAALKIEPQQKHKIRLIRKETGGKSDFWMVNLDGKEIKLCEFARVMGLNNGTVSSWVQRGIFEKRVKELGLG